MERDIYAERKSNAKRGGVYYLHAGVANELEEELLELGVVVHRCAPEHNERHCLHLRDSLVRRDGHQKHSQ
jgi:hypothetical protein